MNELDKLREMLTDAGIPFESIQEKGQHGFVELGRENYGENGKWLRNQIIYGRGSRGCGIGNLTVFVNLEAMVLNKV